MVNNFFLGIWYSPLFHTVTGNAFQVLSLSSAVVAFLVMWQILCSLDFVDSVKEWKSCTCRKSVKDHLHGVFSILLLKTMIILYICWIDFGTGWFEMPHSTHILHYCILLVFICMIVWAHRSRKHFRKLGRCAGSISYFQKINPGVTQTLREWMD